jgi:MinD superfamily P-loop ATPase
VISSLSGADFIVLVTEPTLSGLHDLKRIYELGKKFKLRAGCIINKFDINHQITGEIINFLNKESIIHIGNLPYSEKFTQAMLNGLAIVEYDKKALKDLIINSWNQIVEILNN